MKQPRVHCSECGYCMAIYDHGYFSMKWRCDIFNVTISDRTKIRSCRYYKTLLEIEEDEFVEKKSW